MARYSSDGYEDLCLTIIEEISHSYEKVLIECRVKPTNTLRKKIREYEGSFHFYCPLVNLDPVYFIEKLRKRAGYKDE